MALRGIVKLPNVPAEINTYVRITDARLSKRIIRTDPVTGAALPSPKKAYLLFVSVDWHTIENGAPAPIPYRHDQHNIVASGVTVGAAGNGKADAQILTIAYELLKTVSPYQALVSDEATSVVSSPALMPADLAAFALPDESLADLKTRLLTELTTLRSMAVGNIPMTNEQRAMLTTLEGQVAQQWFTS
jgi:hypothetical protein